MTSPMRPSWIATVRMMEDCELRTRGCRSGEDAELAAGAGRGAVQDFGFAQLGLGDGLLECVGAGGHGGARRV
jgi:hypothetical protein